MKYHHTVLQVPALQGLQVRLLWLLLMLSGASSVFAQWPDYHLQEFGYSAGIRGGAILGLSRDNHGNMWILYPRGAQRFDGREARYFEVFDYLERLFCDDQDGVWVVSPEKVYRFHDDVRSFQVAEVATRDSVERYGALFHMPDGSLWLSAQTGFYRWDPQAKRFLPVLNDLPLPKPIGLRVSGVYDNTLFITKNDSIYAFNTVNRTLVGLPNKAIRLVFPVSETRMLVSTWDITSYWYDFETKSITPLVVPKPYRIDPSYLGMAVYGLYRTSPGNFLLLGRYGLFNFDSTANALHKLELFSVGQPVYTNDFANQLYLDKEGFAWLATISGIARFSLKNQGIGLLRLQPPQQIQQASVNNVRRILKDRDGNLWLATGNGLVTWQVNKKSWEFLPAAQGATDRLAFPSVRGLSYDGSNLILGPADNGVWLFDPRTRRYRRPLYADERVRQRVEHDFIDEITTLRNGDHLITGRDELYLLEGKTYRLRILPIEAGRENSNYAFQDKKGIIWIATGRAIHVLSENLTPLARLSLKNRQQSVTCGYIMSDNSLLYASADGLFRAEWRDGRIVNERYSDLFRQKLINILYCDNQGVVWACGDAGILRYEPKTKRLSQYDPGDNVQGYSFNGNGWYRDASGRLYFGGTNGLNHLYPETFTEDKEMLTPLFRRVSVNGNDTLFLDTGGTLKLKPFQNSIEVEAAAPYFTNPEKISYRYWLVGYDNDWMVLGNNPQLRFTSLPAGSYKLRLQASLNGVDWQETTTPLTFEIEAPFWQRPWFVVLVIFAVAVLVLAFIRNRNQKLREKEEELEAEQAINYFATSLYGRATEEEILWDVARNCIGRLKFEDCVIYLLDEKRQVLVQKAAFGPKSPKAFEIVDPIEIPVGQGIVGAVVLTGQAELIRDTRRDARYIVDDERRLSEIAVPMVSDGKVIGVIDCEHSKEGFFTARHLSTLGTIASLCSSRVTRARAEMEKEAAKQVLQDTKQKMREVEMQALRAQMNPHFIFNCLNSINRYIVKSEQATASLYLTRFAKLIRLILDHSNSKSVVLSSELEALRLYVDMEALRFTQKFTFDVQMDKNVNPDSIEVPPLIIQPFVENAIWHGLLHRETGGCLCLGLRMVSDTMLECVIEDNGIGRDKARELKSKSATTRKSLGMQLTEERLALLNQQAQLNASVRVIDLYDEAGQGIGTRVVLNIPV